MAPTRTREELRSRHLHFDCPSGIAGDMALGALLDLGVPEAVVRAALARLPVGGYTLEVRPCLRKGLAGTDVKVRVGAGAGEGEGEGRGGDEHGHGHEGEHEGEHGHGHGHEGEHGHGHEGEHEGEHGHGHGHEGEHGHRHGHEHGHRHRHGHRRYAEIVELLGVLDVETRDVALRIFARIAEAESQRHAVPIADVSFHEVGAIDSIVDVVGTAAAVAWLAPSSVSATAVALGHGSVWTAHGRLPVPAPATLEILRAAGAPVVDGGVARELTTPTGAAILAALVGEWGELPAGVPVAIGYGAGDAELADRPNLVRAVVVERAAETAGSGAFELVEANVDDMSPELCEHAAERLFAAGAVDVWWTPATMKKGRPAFVLGVLCPATALDAVCAVALSETTTIGVRHAAVGRRVLDRRVETVTTAYGPVEVKLAMRAGAVVNVAPEYESCRKVARATGVPLKEIYAAAIVASRRDRG